MQRDRTPLDAALTEIRTRLEKEFGDRLCEVVLYGSLARGEASQESDMDLMVILEGPIRLGRDLERIVQSLYPVQLWLDRAIHALPVSQEAFEAAQCGLYRDAKRKGLRL